MEMEKSGEKFKTGRIRATEAFLGVRSKIPEASRSLGVYAEDGVSGSWAMTLGDAHLLQQR